MVFNNQIVELLGNLVRQGGLILFFAFLLTRVPFLKRQLIRYDFSLKKGIILILYFSGIGIMGTYTGIPVMGALANARVVGVFVGGLLGGPVVGIASGFLAGFHRFAIDVGGFTAIACMVSTLMEGTLAGLLSARFRNARNKWLFAGIWGAMAEMAQMVIILIIAKPFHEAVRLVQIISLPMILGNAIGIAMFIAISEDVLKEAERVAIRQSHRVLAIVRETLNHLRSGLTADTADAVAGIILKHISLSAVSLSDREKCLAFRGLGEDHHKSGEPLKTKITRSVLAEGVTRIVTKHEDIGCSEGSCPLSSAVIVPLKVNGEIIGTLKLYRSGERKIGPVDVELAQGLAPLFSTQIEVSELQRQKELLATAKLQALQAQIRPHFLFNTLNTIISLIRVQPDRARELMISLGELLRRSFRTGNDFITLEEELAYLRSYLEIEQARFGDKLSIIYDIHTPMETSLPPLILQPIIENSIIHGIGGNMDKGQIEIEIRKIRRDRIRFTLSDTGKGIDKATIKEILNNGDTGESIGLKNVNERLVRLYGEGLDITGEPGRGTVVTFTITGAPR